MQIKNIIKTTTAISRLDMEILLARVLAKPRSYLHSHSETTLTDEQLAQFQQYLARRQDDEPIAYILGHKEFWSLDLQVNQNVLIPRPETELLVEQVLQTLPADKNIKLADLGTGCGAIALAIASERPNWQIIATDISHEALQVASNNAQNLQINNIHFQQGNWCAALNNKFDIIVSNPPYIAKNDPHWQTSIKFEPKISLVAGQDGLDDIKTLIATAKNNLNANGILILEHGYQQAQQLKNLMQNHGYKDISTHKDIAANDRVTLGSI